MHRFLSNFTAVMLFAHTALGCCAHHLHACGEPHGSVALVEGKHPCADACGEHAAASSGQTGHEHQGQDDCQGSPCDFGRPANEREAQSCHVFCQAAAVLPSEVLPVLTGVHLEHDLGAAGVPPPVRLHLVYQVLLT